MKDDEKDRQGGGRPTDFLASALPRTALSAAQNADETRTCVLLRKELRAWRLLQLEPRALREPDDFQAPSVMTAEGRHLPATLYRLASREDGELTLAALSNRLSLLVSDVRTLSVRRDDVRRVLMLVMRDATNREFVASSLSDGTLRFIALGVLGSDPLSTGILCLEEPENGIHPERMSAMLRLLQDMATDTEEPVDEGHPLRQVIISTHSPVIVSHFDPQALVFADLRDDPTALPGERRALVLRPITDTWRTRVSQVLPVSQGEVLNYLGAMIPDDDTPDRPTTYGQIGKQLYLFGGAAK